MRETLTFEDVAMVPNYCPFTSRNDKEIDTSVKFGSYIFQTPIISANMDTITGPEMAVKMHELGGLGILHRFCSIEDNVNMFIEALDPDTSVPKGFHPYSENTVGVSVGVNEGLNRVNALYDAGARIFCLDVAHAHSKLAGKTIKAIKENYPDIFLIAGNVCTYAGADYLVGCGADAIKVGIGSGSACTTRIKTGIGVPQFTAIQDCARCSKPIIADGGCRTPADICKALAAGATMVMLGSMLAGTNETPGETFDQMGNVWDEEIQGPMIFLEKKFRGMASKEANEDQFGTMSDWKTAEGVAVTVPCKGPVENVIKDIMGGLRSCMTYSGAHNLDELRRRVEFVKVTHAGRIESGAHING